jgi:hypothetical protein
VAVAEWKLSSVPCGTSRQSDLPWRRVVQWLRRKHPEANSRWLPRRYLPGWWPAHDGVALHNPAGVPVTGYCYLGTKIPTVEERRGRLGPTRETSSRAYGVFWAVVRPGPPARSRGGDRVGAAPSLAGGQPLVGRRGSPPRARTGSRTGAAAASRSRHRSTGRGRVRLRAGTRRWHAPGLAPLRSVGSRRCNTGAPAVRRSCS